MSSSNRLERKFQKSLNERWLLRFSTIHPDGGNYYGIVVAIRSEFIVVCDDSEFEFNGFQIFPKQSITEVRDGRVEACINRIIRSNQALETVTTPQWISECEGIVDVLHSIHRQDIWPIVESLYENKQKTAFYIGPITKVGDHSLWLRCYDGDGKWEKRYELDYSDIFRIEFGSRYERHFNAYMKSRAGQRKQTAKKPKLDNPRKRNSK